MTNAQTLQKQIAQLPELDASDVGVDAQWSFEAERRLAAYRLGQVKAIPLSEVLAKYSKSRP